MNLLDPVALRPLFLFLITFYLLSKTCHFSWQLFKLFQLKLGNSGLIWIDCQISLTPAALWFFNEPVQLIATFFTLNLSRLTYFPLFLHFLLFKIFFNFHWTTKRGQTHLHTRKSKNNQVTVEFWLHSEMPVKFESQKELFIQRIFILSKTCEYKVSYWKEKFYKITKTFFSIFHFSLERSIILFSIIELLASTSYTRKIQNAIYLSIMMRRTRINFNWKEGRFGIMEKTDLLFGIHPAHCWVIIGRRWWGFKEGDDKKIENKKTRPTYVCRRIIASNKKHMNMKYTFLMEH